ncbi:MAG TPA: FIST N-terminal domain-containing protein, partial [Amaricoccus sp.]|nr:FIST N-terminal domain-containing protein [Amaricoccus sp.]
MPAERRRLGHNARPRVLAVPGDGPAAAAAIAADFGSLVPALVLVFAPDGGMLAGLTGRLKDAFGPGCHVVGCSSAGGFAFGGYRDDRVVAVAFPAAGFRATTVWLRDLRQHMALDWIRSLRGAAAGFGAEAPGWSRFGLLMIDG